MSRKPDVWMPFFIGDYLADTAHLTTEQHGAYFLLLLAAWKKGGRLPNDPAQLAAITRLPLARWRQHAAVILALFKVSDDAIEQGRLVKEYNSALVANDAQRVNGRKGGRPRKQNPTECQTKPTGFDRLNPRANPNETPSPSPVNQKQDQKKERSPSGSRLPDDWLPSSSDLAFAQRERPDVDAHAEAEKFRDYWHGLAGAKARKTNWPATWRNWIRRADQPRGSRSGANEPSKQLRGVAAILGVNAHDLTDHRSPAVVLEADRDVPCGLVPPEPRRLPGR